jgi:hypothetical protein
MMPMTTSNSMIVKPERRRDVDGTTMETVLSAGSGKKDGLLRPVRGRNLPLVEGLPARMLAAEASDQKTRQAGLLAYSVRVEATRASEWPSRSGLSVRHSAVADDSKARRLQRRPRNGFAPFSLFSRSRTGCRAPVETGSKM